MKRHVRTGRSFDANERADYPMRCGGVIDLDKTDAELFAQGLSSDLIKELRAVTIKPVAPPTEGEEDE